MDDLEIVYVLRRRLNRLEMKLKNLTFENVQNNIETNQQTVARISRIEAQMTKLKGIHQYRIHRVYSSLSRRSTSVPIINSIEMKITHIDMGDTFTKLKMTPISFKLDRKKNSSKDIIYPTDGTDRDLINLIAKYRHLIDQPKDFSEYPLKVHQNSIETLIIGLEHFVHQYDGELILTNTDLSYSHPDEKLASGVVNLSSIHLIAADLIPTARFSIKLNLDYDRDLSQSISTMKEFLLQFHKDLTRLLRCQSEYMRIFSVEKLDLKRGMIRIQFGLTTPNKNQTESLAKQFQTLLRRSDFRNERILRFIQSDSYQYQLKTVLSYLQINPKDFHHHQIITNPTEENKDLPSNWFYHPFYFPKKSLHHNKEDSSFIAYHGTQSLMFDENENRMKSTMFLTKHFHDGVDLFSTPFTVSNGDYKETFKIIIQCRVKSDPLTVDYHQHSQFGQICKINDLNAVRPEGLLLKNETLIF